MRNITVEEMENAPSEILYLISASVSKIPVGITFYNECIEKYPEYFPDEIEHRRKRALVPKEVDEAYDKECALMREKLYKDLPEINKGMMYYVNHPEEYKEWSEKQSALVSQEMVLKEKIHKKHYSKYGL